MAVDAYLQIEGIKGESTDDKHKNWIEVSKVIGNVNQPRATSLSTAGGMTSGRASLSDIMLEKLADLSSPLLRQHCAMGKTIPKAVFEFMRADGDGKPICYERITLTNVMISNVTYDSGAGGTMKETVLLAYSKINWEHVKQSIRGGTEGSTVGGWDCAANKVC
ncbi:Hcp family type VI secretion system effector [Massilia horti]|uniref:Type VI secretion system tube protein Hcp n=1 Tax=Massilia horti TaxID=2562153 RepID=A0A4Y9T8X0_9BURK|nr:type VI secretion system tube protein Hcp [Massilia horti]TFW34212.1 type VI secretion system tube protein Hcp [Massilia horti]